MHSAKPLLIAAVLLTSAAAAAQTTRVSESREGVQADRASVQPVLSANGRFVAFTSAATNLVSAEKISTSDIFLKDRESGRIDRLTIGWDGGESDGDSVAPSMSADGQFIVFQSTATNLVRNDQTDRISRPFNIFLYSAITGDVVRLSRTPDGGLPNGESFAPSISADGRYVAFESRASNFGPFDRNGRKDIYVVETSSGRIELVSIDAAGGQFNSDSFQPSISGNGQRVAFANNPLGSDVFVHELRDGRAFLTRQLTVSGGISASDSPVISANGQFVAFGSNSPDIVEGVRGYNVFVRDLNAPRATLVSVGRDGAIPNQISNDPGISADGRFISFSSAADNLVAGDTNLARDVFGTDRLNPRATVLVSVASDGTQANSSSGVRSRGDFAISADVNVVAFYSQATNLVTPDNGVGHIFARVIQRQGCDPRGDCAEVPGPPSNLSAQVTGSTVGFNWQPPLTGGPIETYVLGAGFSPTATDVQLATGSTATSLTVDAPPGTYYVRVSGRNSVGTGPPSNEVIVAVGGSGCAVAPDAPTDLAASVSGGSVSLSWVAATGCPTDSYVLEAGSASGIANLFTGDVGNVTTLTAAAPPATYFVRVRARNIFGVSAPSNEIIVTVSGACAVAPGAPTGLSASVNGGVVSLAWVAATGCPADSYVIEAGNAQGTSNVFAGDVGNVTALSAAAPPGTYYVRVRGRNAFGVSAPSNEVIVTVQ